MTSLETEINRRRTFAIISHPDAGKTTLTEKLLLFGGAIQMAGLVKAKGDRRRATSDWMKVEQERGISVASSVMTFGYQDKVFNLLDTPGHEDFSEDTYRTLTAVDSAIMVLDAAKGIEAQTLKLFEVCRLRNIPIITFINKMDRDGQDPLELMDEIEDKLALALTPATWPIGMGRDFKGCYNILDQNLHLFDKGKGDKISNGISCKGINDPRITELIPDHLAEKLKEDVEMVEGLCPAFDQNEYNGGALSPVYFGSAINNFGVQELLEGVGRFAPSPGPLRAEERTVEATEPKVTGFVFKIQANMDPKHRDRIAFTRIASGKFKRGMKLRHSRTEKQMIIHSPQLFLAQDREMAEEAFAGDIIGIPNHGNLRIGDVLTEGEALSFNGIPSFAPEYLSRVLPDDPMKAKHLGEALIQLAEEGVARAFKPLMDSYWVVGVIGTLQFDVLKDRLRTEYNVPMRFEQTELYTARWIEGDPKKVKAFVDHNRSAVANDHDEDPVFLARNAWHLGDAEEKFPDITFLATR